MYCSTKTTREKALVAAAAALRACERNASSKSQFKFDASRVEVHQPRGQNHALLRSSPDGTIAGPCDSRSRVEGVLYRQKLVQNSGFTSAATRATGTRYQKTVMVVKTFSPPYHNGMGIEG